MPENEGGGGGGDKKIDIIVPGQPSETPIRIIAPGQPPPQTPSKPDLILPPSTIPESILPGGRIHKTPSGLEVVTVPVISKPETIPDIKPELEKTEKVIVPLSVWITTPDKALKRLAQTIENQSALRLLDIYTSQNTQQASAFTGTQKEQAYEDIDKFFAIVIKDTKETFGKAEQAQILTLLTGLADILRSQTKALPFTRTVDEIITLSHEKNILTPDLLQFLKGFSMPSSLESVTGILKEYEKEEKKLNSLLTPSDATGAIVIVPAETLSRIDDSLRKLRAETIQNLPEQTYTKDQKEQIQREMDRLLATEITNSVSLFGTENQSKILAHLTGLADLTRYQIKSMQLYGRHTLKTLVDLSNKKDIITPGLLKFLTRFDIPPSLSGEMLFKLEKAGQLSTPLAWHLLDKLPDEHPFKQKQRERVTRLKELLTGEITPENLQQAKKLCDNIISVFVDPDSNNPEDKVGLEIENTSGIDGITVPPGTTMGQDEDIKSIPELRLDNQEHVLRYGKEWRNRYYQIHLWAITAKAAEASIHFSINQTPQTSLELYKLLFGFDSNHVKKNEDRIEVRTALSGYKADANRSGFSSEYMPELVELLRSLREAKISLSHPILTDRFSFFTSIVEDPTSRAAMLLSLKGEGGLRVVNPKEPALTKEKKEEIIFRSLDYMTTEERALHLPRLSTTKNLDAQISMARVLPSCDPGEQSKYLPQLISPVIESEDLDAMVSMAKALASFAPEVQSKYLPRLISPVIERGDRVYMVAMARVLASYALEEQSKYLPRLISHFKDQYPLFYKTSISNIRTWDY